jgi:hypothetical protein
MKASLNAKQEPADEIKMMEGVFILTEKLLFLITFLSFFEG